jgi:hypothetical protein
MAFKRPEILARSSGVAYSRMFALEGDIRKVADSKVRQERLEENRKVGNRLMRQVADAILDLSSAYHDHRLRRHWKFGWEIFYTNPQVHLHRKRISATSLSQICRREVRTNFRKSMAGKSAKSISRMRSFLFRP